MEVAALRSKRKHPAHSSDFFLHSELLELRMFSVVVRSKVSSMEGVFVSDDSATWDKITFIECCRWEVKGEKYLVLSF